MSSNRAQRIRDRLRQQGPWRTVRYLLGTAVLERLGISILSVFVQDARGSTAARDSRFAVSVLREWSDLSAEDVTALQAYGREPLVCAFQQNFSRGWKCVVARCGEQLCSVAWLTCPLNYRPAGRTAIVIQACFTLPEFRGRSLYPFTLQQAVSLVEAGPVYIESSVFNESSIRGIKKAGFTEIGLVVTLGKHVLLQRVRQNARREADKGD